VFRVFRWFRNLLPRPAPPPHPLVVAARSTEPDVRREAAEQFGGIPEVWAAEELLRLLTDLFTPVRDAARASLRRQGAAAVPVLLQGLSHPRLEVSVASADLLGEFPAQEAIEPLLVALKFSERPVQLAAGRALGRCGLLAVPALRAGLNEPQPWVRAQIAAALAEAEAVGRRAQEAVPGPSSEPAPSQNSTAPPALIPDRVDQ
jgi:HEAT repeat protein